ncbi:MAG: polysaccharide biosynthesis protein [Brevundimonas sp.]|nr:polysaccharide biosynthesis protein [Brevundimonas sp.]
MVEAGGQERRASVPGMGRTATRAMVYMGGTQVSRVVLTLVSTVIVARLLSPGDYGVIAMVAPVTSFVMLFQDLGLSSATIQAGTISGPQSSSLFWRNIVASCAIAAVLVLMSPAVAWFYGDIRAGLVTAASALSVLIVGLSLQHAALMTREMRFAAISVIDVSTAAIGVLATVVLALMLRSYWAIFIGALIAASARTVLIWFRSGWRPSRPSLIHDVSDLARFGRHVMSFNLINFVLRNADNVLIAKVSGAAALGLYDRSYRLMMFPIQTINQPINRLMLPVLSRLVMEPGRYRKAFLLSASVVCWVALPGIVLATVLSDPLVRFLLGERWAAAGPIFFWLGLTGVVQTVPNLTGALFQSTGSTRTMVRWSIFSAVVTLAGFGVGLTWGPVGVAASLFITTIMRTPVLFAICRAGTCITQRDLYAVSIAPVLGATIAAVGVRYLSEELPTPVRLILGLVAVYGLASLAVLSTPDGREVARRATALGLSMLGRRDAAQGMAA